MKPETVEQYLTEIAKHGEVRLYNNSYGWAAVLDFNLNFPDCTGTLRAGYHHDQLTACYALHKRLEGLLMAQIRVA